MYVIRCSPLTHGDRFGQAGGLAVRQPAPDTSRCYPRASLPPSRLGNALIGRTGTMAPAGLSLGWLLVITCRFARYARTGRHVIRSCSLPVTEPAYRPALAPVMPSASREVLTAGTSGHLFVAPCLAAPFLYYRLGAGQKFIAARATGCLAPECRTVAVVARVLCGRALSPAHWRLLT